MFKALIYTLFVVPMLTACTVSIPSGLLDGVGGISVQPKAPVTPGPNPVAEGNEILPTPVVTVGGTYTIQAPLNSIVEPRWVPGVTLRAGERVTLSAKGRVGYGRNYQFAYIDADGFKSAGVRGYLDPNHALLGLVGKFQSPTDDGDDAITFMVGKSATFTAPKAGTLYLGVNAWRTGEADFDHYTGDFTVTLAKTPL